MSKADKRIHDMFFSGHIDDDFLNIDLNDNVKNCIMPYQTLHVMNLVASLSKKHNVCVVDGSNTGTGKTHTAIGVCAQLKLSPFIICSKSVIGYWKSVCNMFRVQPIGIVNYETIKCGKEYDEELCRVSSNIVTKGDDGFVWNLPNPKTSIVIFDEAHKCKNEKSVNGKLLASLKDLTRIMLLSATLCDKPEDFLLFGYMLNFYKTLKQGHNWIQGIIREDKNKKHKHESSLTKHIFPHNGSKMALEDANIKIPENIISVDCYTIDKKYIEKINHEYDKIKEFRGNELVKIIKARQKIEKYKVPILIELCEKYLEANKSVVIFINFLNTMDMLRQYFDENKYGYSYIVGGQEIVERQNNIDAFQRNKNKIIIVMMQSGGESISLHDTDGSAPRVSLISPSLSSIELVQALGRIYRTGVKSKVLQKLVFCDETYETQISQIIKSKLKFLNKLSDNDLTLN